MLTTQSSPAPLNFHAKRIFLTYAQSGTTTKEELRDHLMRNCGVEWYVVGIETHADGGNHLHAYCEWTRPKRVRDCRYFDYNGCHPNIQSVRRPVECQQYCIKENNYIANMVIGVTKRTYGEIIESSGSTEEFLVQIGESFPRDLVLNLERIEKYAKWKFGTQREEYQSDETSFVVPDELNKWYEDNVVNRGGTYRGGPSPLPLARISSHAY